MSFDQNWLYPKQGTFMLNTIRSVQTQPFAFDLLLQHYAKTLPPSTHIGLVLLDQNWSHYNAVATKCGLNLKQRQLNGLIRFVNIFDYPAPPTTISSDGLDYDFDWDRLVQDVQSLAEQLPKDSILMIDDLNVLLSLDIDIMKIYSFIRNLRKILSLKQCSLFISTHYSFDDEPLYSLVTSLIYECETWLDCDQPRSGYSLKINGIAKFHNRLDRSTIEMNYKIANRNVQFKKI